MKNNAGKFLFLLLLTCTSCSSLYWFAIDVQEPAAVTLPVSAQNVLILNNTVKQPISNGIERTFDGHPVRADFPLSLDSTAWVAIAEIADVFNESHFFNTVAIYRRSLRTDSDWLTKYGLSPDVQSDFYNAGDYNTLLVIDRLLFIVKEDVKKIKIAFFASSDEPIVFVDMRVDGLLTCSMYSYGKDKPLTTFTVSDSLFVKSTLSGDSTTLFKDIPEYVLHELSAKLGNQAAQRFTPTWKTEKRAFFRGYNARMQEATGYAANHQWANAESIWTAELGKKTKPVDKAKIAFNLAVANEMQDKLDSAYAWVQKAKEHLGNVDQNKNAKQIELTKKYVSDLEQRIQNNRLLDLQWGKE